MKFYSGNFVSKDFTLQMTQIRDIVKRIEFFPIKSWTSGTPTYNSSGMYMGLETGALPYLITTGSSLLLDYGSEDTLQHSTNFFLKGSPTDGFYVISHP